MGTAHAVTHPNNVGHDRKCDLCRGIASQFVSDRRMDAIKRIVVQPTYSFAPFHALVCWEPMAPI